MDHYNTRRPIETPYIRWTDDKPKLLGWTGDFIYKAQQVDENFKINKLIKSKRPKTVGNVKTLHKHRFLQRFNYTKIENKKTS